VGEIFLCDENGGYILTLKNSPAVLSKSQFNIETILATSKGFIVGGDNAMIYLYTYNPQDHSMPYEMTK
jgi:hypothetical protein